MRTSNVNNSKSKRLKCYIGVDLRKRFKTDSQPNCLRTSLDRVRHLNVVHGQVD